MLGFENEFIRKSIQNKNNDSLTSKLNTQTGTFFFVLVQKPSSFIKSQKY